MSTGGMKAVIMAGGLGMRLRPLTETIPKPLLPVGGRPLLHSIIDKLREQGFTDVYLCLNYKPEMFKEMFGNGGAFGINIHYSLEHEPLGTAGPLGLIAHELDAPFLVMNGDLLTDEHLGRMVQAHIARGADFTAGTKVMSLPLAYGIIELDGEKVTGLREKPNIEHEVLAGIYVISPSALSHLPKGRVLMTDFIELLIRERMNVMRHRITGLWIDIGQMNDYERAQQAKHGA